MNLSQRVTLEVNLKLVLLFAAVLFFSGTNVNAGDVCRICNLEAEPKFAVCVAQHAVCTGGVRAAAGGFGFGVCPRLINPIAVAACLAAAAGGLAVGFARCNGILNSCRSSVSAWENKCIRDCRSGRFTLP